MLGGMLYQEHVLAGVIHGLVDSLDGEASIDRGGHGIKGGRILEPQTIVQSALPLCLSAQREEL